MEFNPPKIWKIIGVILLTTTGIVVGYYAFRFGVSSATAAQGVGKAQAGFALLAVSGFFGALSAMLSIYRLERRQKWLINAVNWNIRQLRNHGLDKAMQTEEGLTSSDPSKGIEGKTIWPWGPHHTKSLGDLEAAARTLWTLYDPGDPSTAPTNDMVADWLVTERGVSKDKARAMASILRADGLPNGPRR